MASRSPDHESNGRGALNLNSPTGGFAYGTPRNAKIPRPLNEVRYLPTSDPPWGKVTFSRSEVLPNVKPPKPIIANNTTKITFILTTVFTTLLLSHSSRLKFLTQKSLKDPPCAQYNRFRPTTEQPSCSRSPPPARVKITQFLLRNHHRRGSIG